MSANPEFHRFGTIPAAEKDFTSSGLIPAVAVCLIVAAGAMAVFQDTEGDQTRRLTRAPVMTEFESNWHREVSTDLAKTLSANRIDDCGTIAFRPHRTLHGQYVAYCSNDSHRWTAWVVDTGAHKVRGPFVPDPLTPLPQ